MKVKKLLCLGMAAALMCSNLLQTSVSAQELNVEDAVMENAISEEGAGVTNAENGDYEYVELEDGTLEIRRYSGDDTELVIPTEIDGKEVTRIGDNAFYDCRDLTSITIPDSVTSIGKAAFSACRGLISIIIPNSVTSIGEGATTLFEGAFSTCSGLRSITIPDGVMSIGNYAFLGCSGLRSITIPDSMTSIGKGVFRSCSGLTSITIPDDVTSIGSGAFSGCSGLTSITIPDGVTSIGSGAFSGCSGLTSITIPDGVTSIGPDAFRDCSGLTSITIPNRVTSLENTAFAGCSGLISIKVEGENSKYDSRENCNAIIETESNILKCGCKNTNIPDSVTSIGSGAFSDCSDLTSITIPDGVTSIGEGAFGGCSGLTSITIPDGVTGIGYAAFSGCSSLTSITIPDGVTGMGDHIFSNCSGLISIKVASENPKYDSRENCNAIIETESNSLIYGCKNTSIPDSVTGIRYYAFWGCSGLTSITIPDSVTVIGNRAFSGCSSLTSITIPDSVTKIVSDAFRGCNDLTIFGKDGSYAKTYAEENGIPFSELRDIANCEITLSVDSYIYDGSEKEPIITVKDGSTRLVNGKDYSVTYSNNINAGTATVTITGIGNYTGTASKTFAISAKSISGTNVTLGTTSYTYDGTEKRPSVTVKDGSTTLISGTHYTVSYSNNVDIGTATVTITGKGNYAGTVTKTFTINAKVVNEKSFVWGKNNWRFDNSSRYFLNYNVNNDVKNKMKKDFNLSNSDIAELDWKIAKNNESGFNGSCFGMTISEIMAYQGDLKLSRYGGSDIVNQNSNTSNMTSVINFIQVLQSNSEMCQSIRQTPFLIGEYPQADFISKLSDVAENSNYLVKLSYKIVTKNTNSGSITNGAHAVLVYGIEKCNYYSSVTGKTYDRKVLIADPNYSSGNVINNDACLYFRSSDSSWIVPYWNKTYSNGRVQSCYWNAESGTSTNNGGIRNIMRYESLKEEVDLMSEFSAGHYIAGLEIDNKSQNMSSVEKVKNSGNPNADYAGDFSDEIVRYDMDMDDSIYMTENDELYALWNPTSSYTLSYLKPSDYSLKKDYETVDYYADVTNSTYTLFKPSGSITLKGSDASYDITMVTDDVDCVTDWYSVTISGTGVDNLVYTKVKDGYTLSASNLRSVKISAEGEDFTAETIFSTNYDDVYIYEIDKNTIGVKVDIDKNGTYETPLITEDTHQFGSKWKTDDKSHWKECECGEKAELSDHKFKWIIDKNATILESGLKHEECIVCGYKRNENTVIDKQIEIPTKGKELTDSKTGAVYMVTDAETKGGTVEYMKPLSNGISNISIPSTVEIDGISYKVTSIAADAFKNNKKLKKIKIGSNVTIIGKNSFSGCSKLETLTIGNNLVSIGDNAFYNCTSLKTVTIPAKVKKIGKQAFYGCKNLKTIKIKTKKLTSKNVGKKAFAKIHPKATAKAPSSCLKFYKKLLQKKGLNGKKQKIKK